MKTSSGKSMVTCQSGVLRELIDATRALIECSEAQLSLQNCQVSLYDLRAVIRALDCMIMLPGQTYPDAVRHLTLMMRVRNAMLAALNELDEHRPWDETKDCMLVRVDALLAVLSLGYVKVWRAYSTGNLPFSMEAYIESVDMFSDIPLMLIKKTAEDLLDPASDLFLIWHIAKE